ncbi:type IV secretory system conjugative DNA transfer family protein [Williamsia herbipolensis]|uniref:type IV secretory system conjugative DNA transfer family protein n=1 Tax=Williamsia herbipolensis TaxID=1603258 RepID=UPI0005F7B0C4|nr:type IV secretory system conjugative DNA transfer family protein [Williamsia herbipolensis]
MLGPVAVLAVVALVAIAYLAWLAGRWVSGVDGAAPANPFQAGIEVATGKQQWPIASTVILVLLLAAVAVPAVLIARSRVKGRGLREFDQAASFMPQPRELTSITARDAKPSANRLRGSRAVRHPLDYGLLLGNLIGGAPLFMPWEWVGLIVGGPRSGKTTGYAIPMICQAPGPVFATSNKADIYDATRWVRSAEDIPGTAEDGVVRGVSAVKKGVGGPPRARGRIWVSDLQNITGVEGQQWWWNPLWSVAELNDARDLASIFAGSSTAADARVDAYFDGGAKELLALHILAAAVGGGDLKHVDAWLTDPKVPVARTLLRANGQSGAAARLETAANLNPRQQDGLYDMARRFLNVMTVPAYARTVVPPTRARFDDDPTDTSGNELTHSLPQFHPAEFVTSTDTMYALSMEGAGAATSLTTALADTIFKAAVIQARRDGGRIAVPVVAVLDEAANVCALPDLPDWYSHFGGQGIVILTLLQSLAQASKVWSKDKLDMLLDSSNAYIYAGSSNSQTYLEGLSRMIGTRDVRRRSRSNPGSGWGNTSTSESWSNEPILGIDDLKAMPMQRAILATSGNRSVLTSKKFWWDSPYADLITASRDACIATRNAATTKGPH